MSHFSIPKNCAKYFCPKVNIFRNTGFWNFDQNLIFSENCEIDILDAIFSAKTPYMMLIMAILKEYNFLNHIIGEKIMAPILHWNPGPQNCYFLDFLLFRRKISEISKLYPNFCLDTMIVILQQCPKTILWGWSQVADSIKLS